MARYPVSTEGKTKQFGGLFRPKSQDHQKYFDAEKLQKLRNIDIEDKYEGAGNFGAFRRRKERAVARDV